MTVDSIVRVGVIGCGSMARYHIERMLEQPTTTRIDAVCEPSDEAYAEAAKLFVKAGLEAPPNQPDWSRFLASYGNRLDAVLIVTPHVYHHDQTKACLEAGLDVLLEKPMVMNADEA